MKVDIQLNGKVIAKDITLPLFKREVRPEYFDIIYSLQQLPLLKDERVHRIAMEIYDHPNGMVRNRVTNFFRESGDNLMTDGDLKRWWANYEGTVGTSPKRTRIIINTPIKGWSCTICGNTALHADMRADVMLPFCSETCLDKF